MSNTKKTAAPHPAQHALDEGQAYIADHLGECCVEILNMHANTTLCAGHVREAAALYAKAVPHNQALKMAIDETGRQAMARVADSIRPTSWKRTCQECCNWQFSPEPPTPLTDAYRNTACESCKSEALDYGSGGWFMLNGKLKRKSE